MSEFTNNHSYSLPRRYKEAGGRPPDGVPHVPISTTLERLASPIPLGGQSVVKRTRGTEGSEVTHDSMVLDDGSVVGANSPGFGVDSNKADDGKSPSDDTTYASKFATTGVEGNGPNESNMYGPWMMVEPRRWRVAGNARNENMVVRKGKVAGSWFAALAKDERGEKMVEGTRVVLTVHAGEGQPTGVIPHKPNVASGSHTVLKIVEVGQGEGIQSKTPLKGIARRSKGASKGDVSGYRRYDIRMIRGVRIRGSLREGPGVSSRTFSQVNRELVGASPCMVGFLRSIHWLCRAC
ncbi:hypothetical protein V6N12_024274 [Hibiscus sabdariffa]|uniref:Uncharacterized protein n=1 Tax=Hibiscus sabdariffa TaxID=183260 RepID=A0ABR2G035_9ROSI